MATTPAMKAMKYMTAFPMLDQQIRPARRPAIRATCSIARISSVAIVLLLPLTTQVVNPIGDAPEQCLGILCGETTAGIAECTHTTYQTCNRQMNTLCQAVANKAGPVSREVIRNAQRVWLAYWTVQKAADNAP